MKKYYLLFLFYAPLYLFGQATHGFSIGAKFGNTKTTIEGIDLTIIPDFYHEDTYTVKHKTFKGWQGGFHFLYTNEDRWFGLAVDFLFSGRNGGLRYEEKAPGDLNYDLDFKYRYLETIPMVKISPFAFFEDFDHSALRGLNFIGGLSFSSNTKPSEIMYESENSDFDVDSRVMDNLKTTLKGKSELALVFGLNYDFLIHELNDGTGNFLSLDVKWRKGMRDLINTNTNNYFIIENDNISKFDWGYVEISLGFSFGTGIFNN